MKKMGFCSNCGEETTNKNICDNCRLKIDNTGTDTVLTSENTTNKHLWSRSIVYFFMAFALDIIGLSAILIEFNSTQNVDLIINAIAIIVVIIQIIAFYVIVYPGLDIMIREDQILYGIIPATHFIIILGVISLIINDNILFLAFGYIVAWSFVGGIIHFYFRFRAIYYYVGVTGLTPEEIQDINIENTKRDYNKTLANPEFRDLEIKF